MGPVTKHPLRSNTLHPSGDSTYQGSAKQNKGEVSTREKILGSKAVKVKKNKTVFKTDSLSREQTGWDLFVDHDILFQPS
jgi:hypothetical protein